MTDDNGGTISVPNLVGQLLPGGLGGPLLGNNIPMQLLDRLSSLAEELFGNGDVQKPAPYPGTTPGEPPYPGAEGWAGHGAEAEQTAKAALAAKTQELKDLDAKLTELGEKIVDDNNEAKKKLQALQAEIDKELKYAQSSDDSSVVKHAAINKFMQDKSAEIAQVITEAGLAAAENNGRVGDLAEQYGVPPAAGAATGDPYAGAGVYGSGMTDPGMYGSDPYAQGYYDEPYYEEPYYEEGGLSDTLGELADTAAGAMPDMGSMMPPMGSMMPTGLGDLGSVIGSALKNAESKPEQTGEEESEPEAEVEVPADEAAAEPPDQAVPQVEPAAAEETGEVEEAGASADQPAPPAPPAPTLVVRPDGSNVTASSPAAAAAARAVLGGAPLEDAYKSANIGLPHPGSPLKDTIELGETEVGDLAQFKDRYVMMMGDRQVYLDGQMQPASALATVPGFVGFRRAPEDPSAGLAPVSTPQAASAPQATAVSSSTTLPTGAVGQ